MLFKKNEAKAISDALKPKDYPNQYRHVEEYVDQHGVKRRKVYTTTTKPSRTQQHLTTEVNIKDIIKRYKKTGHLPPQKPSFYGDFTDLDYHEMSNKIALAQQAFEAIPSDLRSRFGNDPARLLKFLSDSSNHDEAIKLGLIQEYRQDRLDGLNRKDSTVDKPKARQQKQPELPIDDKEKED